jgi:hypothetical protein
MLKLIQWSSQRNLTNRLLFDNLSGLVMFATSATEVLLASMN